MHKNALQEHSVTMVRLLFTAMVVFGGAAIISTRVSGSAVPMVLGLILYFIYLLNELSSVFHGPDSRLKVWMLESLHAVKTIKYGGLVLGALVVVIFAVLALIAFILGQLV
jgi:hypothetical protein